LTLPVSFDYKVRNVTNETFRINTSEAANTELRSSEAKKLTNKLNNLCFALNIPNKENFLSLLLGKKN
jgi:hypothetical protein